MGFAEDWNGQRVTPEFQTGCMKCMMCNFTCGATLCCPMNAMMNAKMVVEGDTLMIDDNRLCNCLRPSPCPCLSYCCCDGPHVWIGKFKKESDTVWVATDESQFKGGCCRSMCHAKGDKLTFRDGKAFWFAGKNPMNPICLQGTEPMAMTLVVGGAPDNASMER